MPTIRASMLASYGDCPRRAASKQFAGFIKDAGYILRETNPTAGASLGTAVHAGAELILNSQGRNVTDEAIELATSAFKDDTDEGAEWDELTPNINVANFQIKRLVSEYAEFAKTVEPMHVEMALKASVGDDFDLTGHIDLLDKQPFVRDLKTGRLERPYQAQLGAYSLLAKAEGIDVQGVAIDWLPRTPRTKVQEPVQTKVYALSTCENAAWATIQMIKRDVVGFKENGDAWNFNANPMSLMCNAKFCPAHGTNFCDMHD